MALSVGTAMKAWGQFELRSGTKRICGHGEGILLGRAKQGKGNLLEESLPCDWAWLNKHQQKMGAGSAYIVIAVFRTFAPVYLLRIEVVILLLCF